MESSDEPLVILSIIDVTTESKATMSSNENIEQPTKEALQGETLREARKPPNLFKLRAFLLVLVFDATVTALLLSPLFKDVQRAEGVYDKPYVLHQSLWDLALLAALRISSALYAILCPSKANDDDELLQMNNYRMAGDWKRREEPETRDESFLRMAWRYIQRPAFLCEISSFSTGTLVALKCLVRLNLEITSCNSVAEHPVFWFALLVAALCSSFEGMYIDQVEGSAAECCGLPQEKRTGASSTLDTEEGLNEPLLPQTSDEGAERINLLRAPRNGFRLLNNLKAEQKSTAKFTDLIKVCAPDKFLVLLAFLVLIGATISTTRIPLFSGDVFDVLIDSLNDSSNTMGNASLGIPGFESSFKALAATIILGGILGGCRGAIFTLVGARVNVRLRARLMDTLLAQDIDFFETTRKGDLTSRIGNNTAFVGSSLASNANTFLRSTVQAIGMLVCMCWISWQLSLLALMAMPTMMILSKWHGRYVRSLAKAQLKTLAEGNKVCEAVISSMPTVRAFGAELTELIEFENYMQRYIILNKRAALATLGYGTCAMTLPKLSQVLVLYFGGLMVHNDILSVGRLVAFLIYVSIMTDACNDLAGIYAAMSRALGDAERVFDILNRQPQYTTRNEGNPEAHEIDVSSCANGSVGVKYRNVATRRLSGLSPQACDGTITLKDVSMSYAARPHRTVLENLSLTIPAGSVASLVGSSGSGKTSILSVIQSLYEPAKGEVCIDGIPVHQLSRAWMTQNVAVVDQEPTLFHRSIRRNIVYGLEGSQQEPSSEEIEDAAKVANAADFIKNLPLGYETEVGGPGIKLTKGEKFRIAIARALVRKPRILLLDEASSGMDMESECAVQDAIDKMIRRQRSLDSDPARTMTVVIVSQHLSTLRKADTIFVVDDGKIAEEGNHEVLLSNWDGAYCTLIREQLQE